MKFCRCNLYLRRVQAEEHYDVGMSEKIGLFSHQGPRDPWHRDQEEVGKESGVSSALLLVSSHPSS